MANPPTTNSGIPCRHTEYLPPDQQKIWCDECCQEKGVLGMTETTKKKQKPCKHKYVFNASFLTAKKGQSKGICSKCGEIVHV